MTKGLLVLEWLSRLESCEKLIVGFSGGLDSSVLLHNLATHPTLKSKILAIHINHQISPNANSWQKHCQEFCQRLSIQFLAQHVEFDRSANIENNARQARYAVFSSFLGPKDALILGHHQDDQAETFLLQLFRGAGVDGLAAMQAIQPLNYSLCFRPLLEYSRQDLEHYAHQHGLISVWDESNDDTHYARNYLRQVIMPLLVKKWPGVVDNLVRTSKHCQMAKANLKQLAQQDCAEDLSKPSLYIGALIQLSPERLINVLRLWLKQNNIQLPSTAVTQRIKEELIGASADAQPLVSWNGINIRRYQERIYIDRVPECRDLQPKKWLTYPQPLELQPGWLISAACANEGLVVPVDAILEIRFRKGGESLAWHGQTKQLKKLFQEWKVVPWLRDNIPLIYINQQLAAVVGYAVSDNFYGTKNAAIIHSISLSSV